LNLLDPVPAVGCQPLIRDQRGHRDNCCRPLSIVGFTSLDNPRKAPMVKSRQDRLNDGLD
jgi:hypothetical protein